MFKNKKFWISVAIIVIILGSAYAYSRATRNEDQAADTPPLQTSVVRQGDIIVSASGTGSLIPAAEVNVAFQSNGLLTDIYVSVGEEVEKGQLLAQLDDQSAQIQFGQAERNLLELTSPAAIAEAKQAVAQAQDEVDDAFNLLEYLVSPKVIYWEQIIEETQESLEKEKTDAETSPSDEADQAVEEAERLLTNAEKGLQSAWYYYEETYLEDTFTVENCTVQGRTRTCNPYVSGPSEATIADARFGLELAELRLLEAEYLLEALTVGEIPEGATGSGIAGLEQAQLNFLSAQINLETTQLVAPISGTITKISGQVGESAGSSPILTISDLGKSLLQIYLDETDFDKIDLDYEVEVVFDAYPDDVFTGYVIQVDPKLANFEGVSAVSAVVQLDEDSSSQAKKLLIGSNASVEVIAGKATKVLLVPVEALRELSPGEYAVFVIENDEPKLRMVEVGLIEITYAEIISGLEPGDVVSTGIVETD